MIKYCRESYLLKYLRRSKKVLLIEPNYTRKYIPLGLAKIATLVKQSGGEVVFKRKYESVGEDIICITSLFTYDSQKVHEVLNSIYSPLVRIKAKVFIGGVYASLMPEKIKEMLLKKSKVRINLFKVYSKKLDSFSPDYSIDWGLK